MPTPLGTLVGRVLNRVSQQKNKSQPWYPTLLGLMVDFPILLSSRGNLILLTHCTTGDASTSCLAYLRQRYLDKESSEGTKLLLASWRQKSSKPYDLLFENGLSGAVNEH